jgi:Leucine-rich repeat (LRR) protein
MKKIIVLLGLSLTVFSAYSQDVYIPDAKFKAVLLADVNINTNQNTEISIAEATNYSGILTARGKGITDLTGLMFFANIKELDCRENQISSIDVTKNINLTKLIASNNLLTSIDVSKNVKLTQLVLDNNQLTSLDVSKNPLLDWFTFKNNKLTTIDVSAVTNLNLLGANDNLLTSLDVSSNSKLRYLYLNNNELTSLNLKNISGLLSTLVTVGNKDLFCIEVDNPSVSTSKWTFPNHIDAYTVFNQNCTGFVPKVYVPDDNLEQALIDLGIDTGTLDDSVSLASVYKLQSLDISSKNILDMTGIEKFSSLTDLNCSSNNLVDTLDLSTLIELIHLDVSNNEIKGLNVTNSKKIETLNVSNNLLLLDLNVYDNNLTSLNLANCTNLKKLDCRYNDLTSMDLTSNISLTELLCTGNKLSGALYLRGNPSLTFLDCSNNSITGLDLRYNTELTILRCQNNKLTSFSIKNGNNTAILTNVISGNFQIHGNQNLTCIEVDDVDYSTTKWLNKDAGAMYNLNCGVINSVESKDNIGFEISPNPAQNILRIETEGKLKGISIYTISGVLVKEFESISEVINVSDLKTGVYIIKLETDLSLSMSKFAKE